MMRSTLRIACLLILGLTFKQTQGFSCPTCFTMGPDAEKICNDPKNFAHPKCEYDNPFCIVYKALGSLFTRICTNEPIWQRELAKCKQEPTCKMGRCFESGCLAEFA